MNRALMVINPAIAPTKPRMEEIVFAGLMQYHEVSVEAVMQRC